MNSLYNRKAYIAFGPVRKLNVAEQVFITGGTTPLNILTGFDNIGVANLGWPFVDLATPLKDDNKGFSDLRVSFVVEKTLESKENEADIEVYNISRDSYRLLQQITETYSVQLSIGYGESSHSLFLGNIEKSSYHREKADWILNIKGKDGQEVLQDTIINKSYREEFDLKSVLIDMISSTDILSKDAFKDAKKWINEKLTSVKKTQNGLSISGRLVNEINKLLSEFDASLSIQDEKAQIIYNNSNTNNDIVLLNPSTGLLGSPIDKGKEEGIEFRCLLIPIIKPGSLVKIQSKTINDYYRVDKIIYKGDTYGNDWECRCEAVRPTNIITDLPEIKYYSSLPIEQEIGTTWKHFI